MWKGFFRLSCSSSRTHVSALASSAGEHFQKLPGLHDLNSTILLNAQERFISTHYVVSRCCYCAFQKLIVIGIIANCFGERDLLYHD